MEFPAVLLVCFDKEPEVPHIQSLEFYAHELFARDAEAIREFLKMGRTELAIMTATKDPEVINQLLPVLNEMLGSSDPRVSPPFKSTSRNAQLTRA